MQFVIWFAGLRGAIPFALAFNMPQNGPMWNREIIVTTTLIVCLLTTIVLGGMTEPLLKRMNLSVTENEGESDDEGYTPLAAGDAELPVGGIHQRWRKIDAKLFNIFSTKPASCATSVVDGQQEDDQVRGSSVRMVRIA